MLVGGTVPIAEQEWRCTICAYLVFIPALLTIQAFCSEFRTKFGVSGTAAWADAFGLDPHALFSPMKIKG